MRLEFYFFHMLSCRRVSQGRLNVFQTRSFVQLLHLEREAQKKVDVNEEPAAIWDHSRDMSIGGRLMDEKQRNQMLRETRGLGDKFAMGKSGGFL
ncbi:hypothetical protein EDD15DRAFT_991397 [Pisolithus albus]|nr:hypothetical protein EDD15DRAFT_991397 [Pisolithus albus]